MSELCEGIPYEFQAFMEYCRSLKFEDCPDYKVCIGFFDKCMQKNNFDARVSDFTWKQNRLSKDKELLKSAMMNVIKKKPKKNETAEGGAAAKKE